MSETRATGLDVDMDWALKRLCELPDIQRSLLCSSDGLVQASAEGEAAETTFSRTMFEDAAAQVTAVFSVTDEVAELAGIRGTSASRVFVHYPRHKRVVLIFEGGENSKLSAAVAAPISEPSVIEGAASYMLDLVERHRPHLAVPERSDVASPLPAEERAASSMGEAEEMLLLPRGPQEVTRLLEEMGELKGVMQVVLSKDAMLTNAARCTDSIPLAREVAERAAAGSGNIMHTTRAMSVYADIVDAPAGEVILDYQEEEGRPGRTILVYPVAGHALMVAMAGEMQSQTVVDAQYPLLSAVDRLGRVLAAPEAP